MQNKKDTIQFFSHCPANSIDSPQAVIMELMEFAKRVKKIQTHGKRVELPEKSSCCPAGPHL